MLGVTSEKANILEAELVTEGYLGPSLYLYRIAFQENDILKCSLRFFLFI